MKISLGDFMYRIYILCIHKKNTYGVERDFLRRSFSARLLFSPSLCLSLSLPTAACTPFTNTRFLVSFPLFLKNLVCTFIFSGFFLFPFYPPPPIAPLHLYIYYILEIFSYPFQPSSSSVRGAHSFRSLPRAPPPAYIAVALQSSGKRPGDFLLFIIYPGVPA